MSRLQRPRSNIDWGGRHTRYAKGTPMTNMYLAMLDMIGVRVDSLGDSTGKLELLSL